MRRQRRSFREALQEVQSRRTQPEYLHKSFQGVDGHPKLERLRADGWEVVGSDPVMLAGVTIRQRVWRLRRPNPLYTRPADITIDLGVGCTAS
jgi:hypothetical protein